MAIPRSSHVHGDVTCDNDAITMRTSSGWSSRHRSTQPWWSFQPPGAPSKPSHIVGLSGWALVLGLLVCLGFLAVVLQTGILPLNPFGGPDADSILAFFFWVTVVPLTIGAVVGAVLLVRTAPDLVRRQEIVGEVIAPERVLYRIPNDGSYADYGFYYRLKVRDQRSGRVETFHVGSETLTSAGSSILYYLQLGDWVRLVVTPRLRRVLHVEAVRDRGGRPLPPLGRKPETPDGAPVRTEDFMKIVLAPMPHISSRDVNQDGATIRVWTYRFEGTASVEVYLAAWGVGAAAVRAYAAPGQQEHRPVPARLGASASRLEPAQLLLIPGTTVIGVKPAGEWNELPPREQNSPFVRTKYPRPGWDEHLAVCVVESIKRGAVGLREGFHPKPRGRSAAWPR